jgi:dual specificity tyrosine-phosphorylation-regulated kinase 2/3/4
MAAAAVIQPSTSLPRIKQLYTTPATPASSPSATFSLPSAAAVAAAAARRRYSDARWGADGADATAASKGGSSTAGKSSGGDSPSTGRRRTGALSGSEALAKYRRVLTNHEQKEIVGFSSVWFVGATARKNQAATGDGPASGYDDEKGRYKCVKNDHLVYRYEVLKGLGKGSFGDVVKAYDHRTKSYIAIKIIRNERRFHKQAVQEVKILDLIRRQDKKNNHNLIHMKDSFTFRGHLCITFEMMHCDLYASLKEGGFRGVDKPTLRAYAKSLVSSLRVLRRSRIIHCDLKPENILLKQPGSNELKVIDFGSSCFDTQKVHTYIQSRFYRSPEVMIGLEYGVPIDMWSFGCIVAELHSGRPIFPGRDEKEQLLYQMEVLGVPPNELIGKASRRSSFFGKSFEPLFLNDKKGRCRMPGTRPLSKAVGSTDPVLLDFIARCLTWDPALRMTPREAAHHEFITGVPAGADDRSTTMTPSKAVVVAVATGDRRDSRADHSFSGESDTTSDDSISGSSASRMKTTVKPHQRTQSDPPASFNEHTPEKKGSRSLEVSRSRGLSDSQMLVDRQLRRKLHPDSPADLQTKGSEV